MPGFLVAVITALHIGVCIALMASILLQSGKGGGLAGAFGAGSSQTLFGGRGAASFLSRATTVLSVVFFVTSLTLGLSASRGGMRTSSLTQEEARRRSQQRPVTEGSQPPSGAPATGQGVPTTGAPPSAPVRDLAPTTAPAPAGPGAAAPGSPTQKAPPDATTK